MRIHGSISFEITPYLILKTSVDGTSHLISKRMIKVQYSKCSYECLNTGMLENCSFSEGDSRETPGRRMTRASFPCGRSPELSLEVPRMKELISEWPVQEWIISYEVQQYKPSSLMKFRSENKC